MGDSDDEYDRRRRDKFRRERSDYGREDRRGREWRVDRGGGRREAFSREAYDRRRERFSPGQHEIGGPMKRMRHDWDEPGEGYYQPMGGSGGYGGYQQGWGQQHGEHYSGRHKSGGMDINPANPMMSFKQFMLGQDDDIDDETAVKKYKEYKIEYRRQQLSEFFNAHKEEEWFKVKYHPKEAAQRKEDLLASVKNRLESFMYLFNNSWCDNLLLDIDKSEQIVRFLDAVVIKMEGGTDLDLKVLDNESEDEEEGEEGKSSSSSSEDEDEEKKKNADDAAKEMEMDMTSKERELQKKAKEFLKKKHENQTGFDEDEEDSGAEADREPADQVLPVNGVPDEETVEDEKPKSDEQAETKEKDEVQNGENKTEEGEKTEDASEPVPPKPNKPRALHKTLSIFLRNLAPSITKQEVEAMCKRFPGYLRVALSDPAPERKFFRRGWVTFTRDVNIKEICWNLNNIRLRDCEMGPIVNRDLQRRIRPVNGITAHRQIVKNDIKYASKIICVFDNKRSLWADEGHEKNEKEKEQAKFGVNSRNPLLRDITDYFIDEMSAEEEELLGKSEDADKSESTIERDNSLCAVLDKLILYLRVVHSLDYYNTSEYPLEDEMPNRCGIMHGRGPTPINPVTQDEITEFIDSFAAKIEPFLESEEELTDDESLSLGKKDPEIEVEKFIQANTQELGKDKWLCPLSGKKFKGPEFIRKHLLNKHSEKLDEVRAEVEYFNNYLMDLKRPTSASEAPKPSQSMTSYSGGGPHQGGPTGGGYQPRPPMPPSYNHYGGGGGYQSRGGYGGGPYGGRENYSSYRGGMRGRGGYGDRRDPRGIIHYEDLDRPSEYDIF